MRSVKIVSVFFCLGFFECSSPKSQDIERTGLVIFLEEVYINQYESDSLNKVRPFVAPRMYFNFSISNHSADSIMIILNSYFDPDTNGHALLYVLFEYAGTQDTLLLTDYQCPNPLIFAPDSPDGFIVGVPINDYLEKPIYKNEPPILFMKHVAENGTIWYRAPNSFQEIELLESRSIERSKNFQIRYTDPENTAVD